MLSSDPNNRPNANQIISILNRFDDDIMRDADHEIDKLKRKLHSLQQQLRQKQQLKQQHHQQFNSPATNLNISPFVTPIGRRSRLSDIFQSEQ